MDPPIITRALSFRRFRTGGDAYDGTMPFSAATLRQPRHRVAARAQWIWLAGAIVRMLVLALVLVLVSEAWSWFPMPWWAWTVFIALAVIYAACMPPLRYRTHRWETTEGAVYTQSGWLGRECRIAPLSRVQTVDVAQSPLGRMLRLATVTVTTASAKGPLRIAGLPRSTADDLVADLSARTEQVRGDAT